MNENLDRASDMVIGMQQIGLNAQWINNLNVSTNNNNIRNV